MPLTSQQPRLQHAAATLEEAMRRHARYSLGKEWEDLHGPEVQEVLAMALREIILDNLLATERRQLQAGAKRLHYLSMEFLMGRLLGNNLLSMGILEAGREAVARAGANLEEVAESERDPALGNGGLGRLAACYLDSLATLGYAATGHGINYEFGLFRQTLADGYQVEEPDAWRTHGSPWLLERPREACLVPLYGRVHAGSGPEGASIWSGWKAVIGVPSDMPVVGYGGTTVNVLRLYAARPSAAFDMAIFNGGDYIRAVEQKITSETISKVLYPSDSVEAGRELRLIQEYFLVACSIRDLLRLHLRQQGGPEGLADHAAIQLNDTHPALAVAELQRTLVDEHRMGWGQAWEITRACIGFTNHTLMPEALERWPVGLLESVVPRHMQIIRRINDQFLGEVRQRWPEDEERQQRMSIVSRDGSEQVIMAHLAIVGSHSVNGVARLHSELIKSNLVPDFHQLWPERFNNKTNGVTQRRWLLHANPGLARLVSRVVGDGWITDLSRLRGLEDQAGDAAFISEFAAVKHANKERLARLIRDRTLVQVDPRSLFDIQAKRIHEYKRQLLNVLHIIHQYLLLVDDGVAPPVSRTWIFAGKAAPGYWAAKQIIKLVNAVAEIINSDPRAAEVMRVVFLPDYRVSQAEQLIPAADLSEQISTAGTEASGTGNMKFALNGALTMGTLDGANIEIRDEVGEENLFIFGHKVEEIGELRRSGAYRPWDLYHSRPEIRRVLDALRDGRFSPSAPDLFRWVFDTLLDGGDPYFHLADLGSYIEVQARAASEFGTTAAWMRKAILNVARIGAFSSDRAITEYAREIWGLRPVP